MKVTSYAVARPAYYDRGAISVVQNYSASLAPHAQVTRWTTTVASGRKMNIELANVRLLTDSAATVKSAYDYGAIYITSGAVTFSLCDLILNTNTVNTPLYFQMSGVPTLYAGEIVFAATASYSTGGVIQYLLAMKATDYAA